MEHRAVLLSRYSRIGKEREDKIAINLWLIIFYLARNYLMVSSWLPAALFIAML